MTGPGDADLVEAARGGDERAFETLYVRHRDWVLSVAYRFTGNREDALDVLQETFTYLFRKLPDLVLRCRMRTFLYPAVKHLALSRKARAARQVPLEAAADPPAPEKPLDELRARIASLPEGQREVLWPRFADGLELGEIAETLAIPLGTVKSRLHAALEALRRRGAGRMGG